MLEQIRQHILEGEHLGRQARQGDETFMLCPNFTLWLSDVDRTLGRIDGKLAASWLSPPKGKSLASDLLDGPKARKPKGKAENERRITERIDFLKRATHNVGRRKINTPLSSHERKTWDLYQREEKYVTSIMIKDELHCGGDLVKRTRNSLVARGLLEKTGKRYHLRLK